MAPSPGQYDFLEPDERKEDDEAGLALEETPGLPLAEPPIGPRPKDLGAEEEEALTEEEEDEDEAPTDEERPYEEDDDDAGLLLRPTELDGAGAALRP